jgi:hypothetical protein
MPDHLTAGLDRYGAVAARHMRRNLPGRYHQLADPASYFRALGDLMAAEVEELTRALLAGEPTETAFLARAGQLRSARTRAEEMVFAELVYLTPPDTDRMEATEPMPPAGEGPGWADWQMEMWHRGLDPDTARPLTDDCHILTRTRPAAPTPG